MNGLENTTVGVGEESAIEVLVSAFRADPAVRWMFPDEERYERFFPGFAHAFAGAAFTCETDLQIDGAVALWLPAGVAPDDEKIGQVVGESVEASRIDDVFSLFEAMGQSHPSEPHWYLSMIGVAPARQNKGLGAALMRRALERCDATRLPAYLESTNPRNIPFYERLGFRVIGEITAPGCPILTPMWREMKK